MKGHRLQALGYSLIFFLLLPVACTLSPVYAAEIGQSRINAASPLYFLKSIREILELRFAGTTHVKAIRELEFATRRLREAKSLAQTPHEDLIEPTLERYWFHLGELKGIANLKDENTAVMVVEAVTGHMNTLQTVYGQVSEISARRSIRTAVNRLAEWDQQLIDKLDQKNQSPFVLKVIASKLSGCGFLSRQASSSALNKVEKVVLSERAQKCPTLKP